LIAAIEAILIVAAGLLLVPALVIFIECAAAMLPRRPSIRSEGGRPRIALLIPAHDEESQIAETIRPLLAELTEGDRLLVVADNCADRTAEIARQAGASVIERRDPDRRGKGYALELGVRELAQDPPDVVVIVDADCRVEQGSIAVLADRARALDRPVQADYVLAASGKSPKAAVSHLAIVVRNRARPSGLLRLGLPSHLTGSGMAFPWRVLHEAPSTGSYLVEDMLMGLEMARQGRAPVYCPEARVSSFLPDRDQAAMGQRRRWEHGSLGTALRQAPRLVGRGLVKPSADLLALGLDLSVPPLALFVVLIGLSCAGSAAALYFGASALPLALSMSALMLVWFAVLGAWIKFARRELPITSLIAIPLYVAWKIPLYAAFLFKRQKSWTRTERARKQS
jgi:cellulose synthase/poly-beta-1,6-N-acetylglucosamine synthase-like glycosyltransferase